MSASPSVSPSPHLPLSRIDTDPVQGIPGRNPDENGALLQTERLNEDVEPQLRKRRTEDFAPPSVGHTVDTDSAQGIPGCSQDENSELLETERVNEDVEHQLRKRRTEECAPPAHVSHTVDIHLAETERLNEDVEPQLRKRRTEEFAPPSVGDTVDTDPAQGIPGCSQDENSALLQSRNGNEDVEQQLRKRRLKSEERC
ncbi:Hypothetical predicted protein [Paramuricea clavata]|uniref:Uncharacterized protein n=1 Tax=Paramuricea clavata TaxID=317549 RepID=A0A6S7HPY5_PARCT|nr:Hypothetical predicted protein [Paramuricea clavata]